MSPEERIEFAMLMMQPSAVRSPSGEEIGIAGMPLRWRLIVLHCLLFLLASLAIGAALQLQVPRVVVAMMGGYSIALFLTAHFYPRLRRVHRISE
jgi:hypothetical protein